VTIQRSSRDLWTYHFERGTLSRLTTTLETEFDPAWSADGRELFYVVDSPPFELFRIPAGATDAGQPIWDERPDVDTTSIAVAPDGKWLAFAQTFADTGEDVYVRPIDGSEAPRPFRASRAEESFPSFSPDGRWLAYQSDETGRLEIYVEAFPGPGERFQVSADGGVEPIWSRSSSEIFFLHREELFVVEARVRGDRLTIGTPRSLFRHNIVSGNSVDGRTYDVTADGQRILAVSIPRDELPRRVEFVTDLVPQLHLLAPSTK
jgi:hypothetical protein